jgi:hypothetical protein
LIKLVVVRAQNEIVPILPHLLEQIKLLFASFCEASEFVIANPGALDAILCPLCHHRLPGNGS